MQTLTDEPLDRPVGNPYPEQFQQGVAIHAVEKGLDVRLKNPVHFAPARHPVKGADRVVSASTGSKTIRAFQKVLLVDGLQHFTQGVLYDLVLERTEVRFLPRSVPYLAEMPNGRVRPLSFGMCTRRIG